MAMCVWGALMANIKTSQDRLRARPVSTVLNLPLDLGFLPSGVLVSVSLSRRRWAELL